MLVGLEMYLIGVWMMFLKVLERDVAFYTKAIVVAGQSDYATRVGAVAAKGNKSICAAANSLRNPANNVSHGQATYHAEYNVLRMVQDPTRVTVYIARLNKSGDMDMPSRPCNQCMKTFRMYGFPEIVYLDSSRKLVKEKL